MYVEVVVDRTITRQPRPPAEEPPYPEVASLTEENRRPPADNPLAVTFHYHAPPHLVDQLQPGHQVVVPFRRKQLTAIVVGFSETAPVDYTRPVADILDPVPMLTPTQLDLAYWLSYEYLAPLNSCLKLFLPPGTGRKPEVTLRPTGAEPDQPLNAQEQTLLTYLRQAEQVPLAEVDPDIAQRLIDKGLARQRSSLSQPAVGPKTERMVELRIAPDEIEAVIPGLGRASKQAETLLYLADLDDPLPPLAEVLSGVGCSESPIRALADKGYVEIIPAESRAALLPAIRAALQDEEAVTDSEAERAILDYLFRQNRPALIDEIPQATQPDLDRLVEKGLIAVFEEPKRLTLTVPPDQLTETIIELRHSQKQVDLLRLLAAEEGPVWIGWVYAQTEANLKMLRDLAGAGLIRLEEARRWRDPLAERSFVLETPPRLTPEQEAVWQAILKHGRPGRRPQTPILLHGVTGSGKTEIYLRAIAAARRAGRTAILLIPEISLAAQTVNRVAARFPGQVAVWHSALSTGERYDTWERVRAGELPIVVGPRSALFAPLSDLGVIIVDEEHEPAYKQFDRQPGYHTRETALELARLSGALVIMGSATPDVVSYRKAERGEYRLLSLPNRILAHTKHLAVQKAMLKRHKQADQISPVPDSSYVALPLPRTEVIDMREELRAGNRTIFSRTLQDGIQTALSQQEQVILFLNRRGAATFVICRDCGYVMDCPQCDTTLTYHARGQVMICHYCGYRTVPTGQCPECGSRRIRYFGLGTQRVEEAIREMFPQARTIRWDWDTTRQKGSPEMFLERFSSGQADIMIGTQMVAKGLDLPLVTVVGVISADTALYLPDFRAAERTFQLLMQVAGRAGRSPLGGRVVIQSYNPDLAVIQAASRHDYADFYQTELAFRREQRYPPFKRLALLFYSGSGPERSAAEAREMSRRLHLHIERRGLPAVELIGPSPAYVPRLRNQYRWRLLVRAPEPAAVLRPLLPLPPGWRVDVDPVSML